MIETFNSLFDIYPDKVRKGAVDAYRRPDGTLLEFPCTLETGNAVKDKKGRWTASGLGLIPSVCRYSEDLKLSAGKEAWIGRGFGETSESEQWFDNPDLFDNDTFECIRFIDGVSVVGDSAFKNFRHLASVTLPDTVREIGTEAFSGTRITSIAIPRGVKRIKPYTFARCRNLTDITLPEGISAISTGMFLDCEKLAEITIPESVTEIGYKAFYGCSALKSITVPKGVTIVGSHAFAGCISLKKIMIPDEVKEIGESAFSHTGITSIEIPCGVKKIEPYTFWNCRNLTKVSLPSGIMEIKCEAFSDCRKLTDITIPDTVMEIEKSAFKNCRGLTILHAERFGNGLFRNAEIPERCIAHREND